MSTRLMRFAPGETESQTTLRAMLEGAEHPARPAIVYWVVRPFEPTLRGVAGRLTIASFFTHHRETLACLDWPLWTFLETCPAPRVGARRTVSEAVQPFNARDRRYAGLALPMPVQPVHIIEHVSEVLWNDRSHLRHRQL